MRTQSLKGLRILVVEDQYIIALDLAEYLSDHGAVILGPVRSVATALKAIAEPRNRLDAAILDIDINNEMAFPVADALAQSGVPFLFLTGYGERFSIPERHSQVKRLSKPAPLPVIAAELLAPL